MGLLQVRSTFFGLTYGSRLVQLVPPLRGFKAEPPGRPKDEPRHSCHKASGTREATSISPRPMLDFLLQGLQLKFTWTSSYWPTSLLGGCRLCSEQLVALPRSSCREVRIRVPFFLQSILVKEPPPPQNKSKGKRARSWGTSFPVCCFGFTTATFRQLLRGNHRSPVQPLPAAFEQPRGRLWREVPWPPRRWSLG